jgi:hypothetical protein
MTDQHSNTCDIRGYPVHVVDKWSNRQQNLYVEITEYSKSGTCTVDREILTNNKPSTEEERLKRLWGADLVLGYSKFENWEGDERNVTISVYNYSTASTVNENLIRSEEELEEYGEEILNTEMMAPQQVLDERGFESTNMYLIFGTFEGEV